MNENKKPREIDTQIKSIRGLAKVLGKAPSTIHSWLSHPKLPQGFPSVGPWHDADVEVLREWSEETLQKDRARHRPKQPLSPMLASPGQFSTSVTNIIADAAPWRLRRHIGEPLFSELTVADLEYLAALLDSTTVDAMTEAAGEITECGSKEYFARLMSLTCPDNDAAMAFGERLWRTALVFCAMRFIDAPGWWEKLADPQKDPGDFFKGLEPLPHRAKREGAGE